MLVFDNCFYTFNLAWISSLGLFDNNNNFIEFIFDMKISVPKK